MTAFSWIAIAVAIALYFKLPRKGLDAATGSVLVGFMWPVLLVMAPYFWVKWRVLKWQSSPGVLQLEIVGCLVATAVGMGGVLWLTDDPLIEALKLL
jgi:hypothetical protein